MLEARHPEVPTPMPAWLQELPLANADALAAAIVALPEAVLVTDLDCSRLLLANSACYRIWGLREPITLSHLMDRMATQAAVPQQVVQVWSQPSQPTSTPPRDEWIALADGRTIAWKRMVLRRELQEPWGILHFFEEVPPKGSNEPTADALFHTVFQQAAVGIALVAADGQFLQVNEAFCFLLGQTEAQLVGTALRQLVHPEDLADTEIWQDGLPGGREASHLELRCQHQHGPPVWLHLSISVVNNSDGTPQYGLVLAEDITTRKVREAEQERRTQELMALASTDPLTGLYNQRFMVECLARRVADAKDAGQTVSVLMIDADQFRELNLQSGHDAGNRALCCLSDAIRHSLRENDVACRYGGDEFLVILVGVPYAGAIRAAERVRDHVEASGRIAALASPITCSIGVATYPTHASTPESLLKAADLALYQAKHEGKNRVVGFETASPVPIPAEIEELKSGLQGASLEAVNALVTAIDLRDRFTGAHCQRVARVAVELAQHLGLSEEEVEAVRVGAPLLDVGKIGLPDALLTKEGKLTQAEWTLVRKHPVWGEQLVRKSSLPEGAIQIVRWHHERLDGSGYPDALTGDEIPKVVRVVSVADVATALREDRPHRRAWPRARVREYLQRHAGSRLDADAVNAWCELYP